MTAANTASDVRCSLLLLHDTAQKHPAVIFHFEWPGKHQDGVVVDADDLHRPDPNLGVEVDALDIAQNLTVAAFESRIPGNLKPKMSK